jgi:protein arginine kinase activator
MLCERCKQRKATVFLTQIIGGKMQKVDLCEKCARETGASDSAGFSLASLLLGLGESPAQQELSLTAPAGEVCPSCGFTLADLKKTGRLGCPDCYDTFAEHLTSVLKETHRASRHSGKVPARQIRSLANRKKLADLEQDLAKAVSAENFEKAAWIRDQIRLLQDSLA